MIERLKKLFSDGLMQGKPGDESPGQDNDLAMAVAALMIEVMLMDGRLDEAEHRVIGTMLKRRFAMHDADVAALVREATERADQAHDLYQFTSRIIKGYPVGQRTGIVEELWRVAMADGHVDAYEEQLIRRIAELIGVHHHYFINAKIQAREES